MCPVTAGTGVDPGLADERHHLAGCDAQIDVGQHRLSAVVAEGDPLKGDCTAHRCLVAAGVLVQLRGRREHGKNPARPRDAVAHLREHHCRLVAGVAEQRHQPDEGDQPAQLDAARVQHHDPVQQRQRCQDAEREQRHVERLDAALPHHQVAEQAGGVLEAAPFPGFAHGSLDHLDAGDHLFGDRGQAAVLAALLGQRRTHAAHVIAHRGGKRQAVERRHDRQNGIDQEHVGQRHHEPDREVGKVDQTGVDHLVDHARVVGGARHQVADALAVVKGLTLAEQAAVQFVAGVALQAVAEAGGARHGGDQRRRVAGHDAEQPKRREQQFAAAEAVDHHLRGAADHHRHQCEQRPGGELAQYCENDHDRIAAQMRHDPASRGTSIESGGVPRRGGGRGELGEHRASCRLPRRYRSSALR